jgi:transcriptional regulator with XRE-family HTH domain
MNTPAPKLLCDGNKVRQLRVGLSLTQEILALKSNVDCRTIQRAEKGSALQIETLASLAAALKVTVNDLVRNVPSESDSITEPKERNAVVLRRVTSGKSLLDIICDSFSGKVYCNAEPTAENIEVLGSMVERLEGLVPDPWQNPFETTPVTLADRLRSAVTLTAQLTDLEKAGIAVYAGTYTASAQVPQYDSDEGHMYISSTQRFRPVTVCRVIVDRMGLDRVTLKVNDEWVEPTPAPIKIGADDEIPF